MLQNIDLYQRLISIKIRAQMQYRLSFLLEVSTTAFVSGVTFLTIALVLSKFEGIAGWSLAEVALLYGMVETAFGIMDMIFSGFDPPGFGRHVRMGTFDQMLLRPVNITLQVLGSEFIIRRLGRILQGALVFGLSIHWLEIHWDITRLALLPVVLVSMVAFFGGLFIIGATITFWTVESVEFINIFTYGGTELMAYPMTIYQDWMRHFFTYIVPAIFLNYYPALYILGKPDPFNFPVWAPLLSPVVGFGVLGIGLTIWNYGIRFYQSTGT